MKMRRKVRASAVVAALSFISVVLFAVGVFAQAPASNRVIGTVASVTGNSVSVKTDAGSTVSVAVPDTARVLQVPPGQKTLTGATKIAITDIATGDRVLMVVAGDPPAATIVVVNKQSDIAAKQQQEQADWAKRGVGGLVKAVDASAGTVTITATNRTITIHTTPSTIVRRYAPDSVKFSEAQTSTLAAIQPGDQITARGDRSGDDVSADEIVSGAFRNIAGTVVSIDGDSFTVKDLVTKKTVTIKTTPDSDLRKLDPQMAQMIATRLKAAGSAQPGAPGGANGAAAPAAGAPGAGGGQYRQAGGGQGGPGSGGPGSGGPGQGGPGGAQAGAAGFARVLLRSPEIHVANLQKGDAVMIVATAGSPDSATAIRLLAGVEPMLQASASGSQSMFSSSWSLGGGAGGDQSGGEGAP
jgi:hypothetical protein